MLEHILSNPYFSAGAGLLGLGTLGAILRQGLVRYSYFIQKQFLVSMEVSSRDKSYHWLLHWLTLRTQSRSNHMSVQTLVKMHDNGSFTTAFNLVPAPGVHYFRWNSRWLKMERQREKAIVSLDGTGGGSPFETVKLTAISRNPDFFMTILDEARRLALTKETGKTVIYTSWANEWRPFGLPHNKRPLSSVVLSDDISEKILNDVLEFNANGKWYHDRGIPYRRGYLLYGPPGTGKSSFIKALAGELDYNICIINLNEGSMTDDRLNYLLSVLPDRSFLLLEDIDALFDQNRRISAQNQSRITFSGLLNALDGVGSSEERIVFMTTNHYDKLDPALLRPGRVDFCQLIDLASTKQIMDMFNIFYPGHQDTARKFSEAIPTRSLSPARIQGHFIMFKNNPDEALKNIDLLFTK